jgi:hypothetical protein
VRTRLIAAGNGKALPVSDLDIAATAERSGATVLHYDGDYDMIASVTGQSMRWAVPAGTADRRSRGASYRADLSALKAPRHGQQC